MRCSICKKKIHWRSINQLKPDLRSTYQAEVLDENTPIWRKWSGDDDWAFPFWTDWIPNYWLGCFTIHSEQFFKRQSPYEIGLGCIPSTISGFLISSHGFPRGFLVFHMKACAMPMLYKVLNQAWNKSTIRFMNKKPPFKTIASSLLDWNVKTGLNSIYYTIKGCSSIVPTGCFLMAKAFLSWCRCSLTVERTSWVWKPWILPKNIPYFLLRKAAMTRFRLKSLVSWFVPSIYSFIPSLFQIE